MARSHGSRTAIVEHPQVVIVSVEDKVYDGIVDQFLADVAFVMVDGDNEFGTGIAQFLGLGDRRVVGRQEFEVSGAGQFGRGFFGKPDHADRHAADDLRHRPGDSGDLRTVGLGDVGRDPGEFRSGQPLRRDFLAEIIFVVSRREYVEADHVHHDDHVFAFVEARKQGRRKQVARMDDDRVRIVRAFFLDRGCQLRKSASAAESPIS